MVFLIDLLTYPYWKSFPKKSVLKIFIILFEQDCPEAMVHGLVYFSAEQTLIIFKIKDWQYICRICSFELKHWGYPILACCMPLVGRSLIFLAPAVLLRKGANGTFLGSWWCIEDCVGDIKDTACHHGTKKGERYHVEEYCTYYI